MLPSEHTDSQAGRLASKAGWEPLLAAGVEICKYEPTMLHNKLLIVDRELVSVGSTNFDQRSFQPNDAASLNVYDKSFADRMTLVFEEDLAKAMSSPEMNVRAGCGLAVCHRPANCPASGIHAQ